MQFMGLCGIKSKFSRSFKISWHPVLQCKGEILGCAKYIFRFPTDLLHEGSKTDEGADFRLKKKETLKKKHI